MSRSRQPRMTRLLRADGATVLSNLLDPSRRRISTAVSARIFAKSNESLRKSLTQRKCDASSSFWTDILHSVRLRAPPSHPAAPPQPSGRLRAPFHLPGHQKPTTNPFCHRQVHTFTNSAPAHVTERVLPRSHFLTSHIERAMIRNTSSLVLRTSHTRPLTPIKQRVSFPALPAGLATHHPHSSNQHLR